MLERLSEQLIAEIIKNAEKIDELGFGEVILKIQDGKAIWWEIKSVWKADSNKREAQV